MKIRNKKKNMFWANLASFALHNRLAVLLTLLIITIFMSYEATKVQLTYEFARLLPDNDSTYLDYASFKEKFGEDGNVMVIGVQDSNFYQLNKFNDWYDIGNKIKKIDGIQEVVSVTRIYNLIKNDSLDKFDFKPIVLAKPKTQQEVDSIKDITMSLPFYEGFIYNKKTHANVMAITFDKVKLNSKNRIAIVDSIHALTTTFEVKYNIPIHYSGLPYIRTVLARKIATEMLMFLGLAFIVTALILLIFFRSFHPVFFSLIVVIIGVIWSFGTIVLLGYKITVLSGLIPPLIIVIGVPNCILLLNKYHTEFLKHGNKARSLTRMVEKIGISTFFANVTTAIGFAVFCITNSAILVEFGLVASLNVMGTFLVSLFLIPVVFSYLPAPDDKHTNHLSAKPITWFLTKVDYWVHYHRPTIYVTTIVLVIISIIGLMKIKAIGFVVDDLPKRDPIYVDMNFFQDNFHGVLPFEISIDSKKKGGALTLNTLYKMNLLQKELKEYKEFSKPLSAVDAIKFSYQAYKGGERKFYILPGATELSKLGGFFNNSGKKQSRFKAFVDSTKQVTRISVQMADVGSIRMKQLVKEIKPRIDSILPPKDFNVTLTGNSLMFLKGNDYLVTNLEESVLLAILLIGLVMITLFASFRMVIISIAPSIIPLLITAGLMGYFGIALKPSTILIFSIAFGIASDGNMYFLTKYRQEFKVHDFSISKTVSFTLKETGVSMIYTAIILFCGFSIFSASSFGGTAALGILISVTLLISYCSNLILLPSFLLSLERRIISKAFLSEPLIQMDIDEDEDIDLDKLKINKPNN